MPYMYGDLICVRTLSVLICLLKLCSSVLNTKLLNFNIKYLVLLGHLTAKLFQLNLQVLFPLMQPCVKLFCRISTTLLVSWAAWMTYILTRMAPPYSSTARQERAFLQLPWQLLACWFGTKRWAKWIKKVTSHICELYDCISFPQSDLQRQLGLASLLGFPWD